MRKRVNYMYLRFTAGQEDKKARKNDLTSMTSKVYSGRT